MRNVTEIGWYIIFTLLLVEWLEDLNKKKKSNNKKKIIKCIANIMRNVTEMSWYLIVNGRFHLFTLLLVKFRQAKLPFKGFSPLTGYFQRCQRRMKEFAKQNSLIFPSRQEHFFRIYILFSEITIYWHLLHSFYLKESRIDGNSLKSAELDLIKAFYQDLGTLFAY